jgi:DNA repair exonuclease SbcCD ATPase subunit
MPTENKNITNPMDLQGSTNGVKETNPSELTTHQKAFINEIETLKEETEKKAQEPKLNEETIGEEENKELYDILEKEIQSERKKKVELEDQIRILEEKINTLEEKQTELQKGKVSKPSQEREIDNDIDSETQQITHPLKEEKNDEEKENSSKIESPTVEKSTDITEEKVIQPQEVLIEEKGKMISLMAKSLGKEINIKYEDLVSAITITIDKGDSLPNEMMKTIRELTEIAITIVKPPIQNMK